MEKWKRKLRSHGFQLHPDNEKERLTNGRYADEIQLFVKPLAKTISMLQIFVELFKNYRLALNVNKNQIMYHR